MLNVAELNCQAGSLTVGPPRIGYIGAVAPGKDIEKLVRVTAGYGVLRLVGTTIIQPDALAGSSTVDGLKRALRANHVCVVGPLSGVAKWSEMASWSIACFPSRSEGLPLAILEARLLGIPVVTHAVGDLPNLARQDPGVIPIAVTQPGRLAEGLQQVLSGPARVPPPSTLFEGPGFAERVVAILSTAAV